MVFEEQLDHIVGVILAVNGLFMFAESFRREWASDAEWQRWTNQRRNIELGFALA